VQAVDCQRRTLVRDNYHRYINFLHRFSDAVAKDRVIWAEWLFTGRRMRLACHFGAIGAIGRVQVSDEHHDAHVYLLKISGRSFAEENPSSLSSIK
jgi:hypothetical protein